MAVSFTPEQQRVIDVRDSNILVSAAAGSGKTAVLVERIIRRITDASRPVDIDRLLIVTFTSAAAAQMRERISAAVSRLLEEHPENEHLQRQASLIHNAQITTIDSFCLFIIRNNFNEIGLDPGFRVADEGEIRLLESDVMNKLLEDAYAEPTPRFLRFVESYSAGSSEKMIEEAILRLYHFAMSYPFPERWLRERLEDYRLEDIRELKDKPWFAVALDYMDTVLAECAQRLTQGLAIAGSAGGPAQYTENLTEDLALIARLQAERDYAALYELFAAVSFTRLSSKRAEGVDPLLKEAVKAIRDEVKDSVSDMKKLLFQLPPEDIFDDMAVCREAVEELVSLTLAFKQRLDGAKRDKNVIDFSDMEHFALDILLRVDEAGAVKPRETALALQDYFEEIMIDEYQDSNEVQELLLKCVSGEEKGRFNRFMVGDVKQSIYKFRLARPEIFMDKYDTYVTNETEAQGRVRIDLRMNFRSRSEVTEAANFICGQLMKKQVGNVEYDEQSALYAGATYPPPPEGGSPLLYQTELLLAVDPQEEDAVAHSEKEREAMMVASRIRELVGHFPVTDAETGAQRPARYADIVLLLRATSGWDEDFRRVLSERGIPVHVTGRAGYFETIEIQGIVNILKVLDNPLQDIPFFGVLRLPCFGFTEEEIVRMKCHSEHSSEKLFLYEQVTRYRETEGQTALGQKAARLLDTIARYRRMVAYTPIKELIQQIINDTGYTAYVGAMQGGDQRRANIELLLERAGAFQKTSFYGLFHFIRYLETMQEQEVDLGEANILDENADVVRIMTIHKSKGLEFPICFVCGLAKQFNQMDVRRSILMDAELGIGVDYIDPQLRVKRRTLRKNVVARRMKEDTRGEDLRVLYVALTRAREKLILTGYVAEPAKKLAAGRLTAMETGEKLPYSTLMKAGSYMDLILAALMRHRCMRALSEELGMDTTLPCGAQPYEPSYASVPIKIAVYNGHETCAEQFREQGRAAILEENLDNAGKYADNELSKTLRERLQYRYPYAYLEGLKVKTTVSELKKASYAELAEEADELILPPRESYVPRFAEADGDGQTESTAVQYGTAVHKVMELLSFSEDFLYTEGGAADKRLYALVCREREQWLAEGRVAPRELSCVGSGRITEFFKSGLAQRIIAANARGELFKEQPFVLGIPAKKLRGQYPETETVLIQGVIDVFFYEGDEIVLADYKTDRVRTGQELIDRYRTQLDYYQMALEQITGKRVKERYLYSFALQTELLC
ncbi:MAG: helicase-exonuclease AddAB subunit AddA [Roseburia sp.]|nr:helicase-exonuclease AddAB subunit AddA [Roseburia sp.]